MGNGRYKHELDPDGQADMMGTLQRADQAAAELLARHGVKPAWGVDWQTIARRVPALIVKAEPKE